MIFIGLGSNLSGQDFDNPREVAEAALRLMPAHGMAVKKLSRFYRSEPVPKSDQPWFVNAVTEIETKLTADHLLYKLHLIEADLGRERRVRWEARVIDLDIIAYHDQIIPSPALWPTGRGSDKIIIPHPRLHERLFVLRPLMDICADWRHPVLGKTVKELISTVENKAEQEIISLQD